MKKEEEIKARFEAGDFDTQMEIAEDLEVSTAHVSRVKKRFEEEKKEEDTKEEMKEKLEVEAPEFEEETKEETEEELEDLETNDDEAETYNCGGCGSEIEYLQKNCDSCGEALMWSAV